MKISMKTKVIGLALSVLASASPAVASAQQQYCIQDQYGAGYTQCEQAVYSIVAKTAAQPYWQGQQTVEQFADSWGNETDWRIKEYNIGQQMYGGPTVREVGFTGMAPAAMADHPALDSR